LVVGAAHGIATSFLHPRPESQCPSDLSLVFIALSEDQPLKPLIARVSIAMTF
jgi:hypothetical protein